MKPGDLVQVKGAMWARCRADTIIGIFSIPRQGFTQGELLIVLAIVSSNGLPFLKVLSNRGVCYIRQKGVVAA